MLYHGICKIEIAKSMVCKIASIIRRGFEENSCKAKCKWGDGELDLKFHARNFFIDYLACEQTKLSRNEHFMTTMITVKELKLEQIF